MRRCEHCNKPVERLVFVVTQSGNMHVCEACRTAYEAFLVAELARLTGVAS